MITKKPLKGGKFVSVTFRSEAPDEAESLSLLGEFNEWNADRHPMKQRKDGSWSVTVRLPTDHEYSFRYLIDDQIWLTEEQSDGTAYNNLGDANAVVRT